MYFKRQVLKVLIVLLLLLNSYIAFSETTTDEQYYTQYLNEFILEHKVDSFKQYKSLNQLKVAYISYFKSSLVKELLENNIGRNDYKISQFVNASFSVVFNDAIEDIVISSRVHVD